MEKETDIEILARTVAEGFSVMEKGFASVNKRLDKMDERFDRMDDRFDRIENVVLETNRTMDRVIMPALDEHAKRIKNLEFKVG